MKNLGHGEILAFLAAKKGISQEAVSERLRVTPQAVSTNFKKNKLKKTTIVKYCSGIGVSYEDFIKIEDSQSKLTSSVELNEVKQLNGSISDNEKLLKLTQEVSFLWRVIAMNGIKIDSSQINFNLGVSVSAYV